MTTSFQSTLGTAAGSARQLVEAIERLEPGGGMKPPPELGKLADMICTGLDKAGSSEGVSEVAETIQETRHFVETFKRLVGGQEALDVNRARQAATFLETRLRLLASIADRRAR